MGLWRVPGGQGNTVPMDANKQYPPASVVPGLQSRKAAELIDFLTGAVGFTEHARFEEHDVVLHAELLWPEGGMVMVSSHAEGTLWARDPGSAQLNVYTHDPDELYSRLKAADVSIIRDLQDTDYGDRGFAINDPDGNLWAFGKYRGQPLPGEDGTPEQEVSFEGHA